MLRQSDKIFKYKWLNTDSDTCAGTEIGLRA